MVLASRQPDERRDREQYFFDAPTVRAWASVASRFENPCLLCAPTVGAEVRGSTVLDVDERFSVLSGFRRFDLASPEHQKQKFGVILCDPPFFAVSLGRLAAAIDLLSGFDRSQPLAVAYLKRRESKVLETFEAYGLRPTGALPGYRSIDAEGRNEIEVYANFDWNVVQRSNR